MINEQWLDKQKQIKDGIKIRLKKARLAARMTQGDIAKKLGVTYQMIQQYENGYRVPKDETIYELCVILNADPEWIRYGRKADYE